MDRNTFLAFALSFVVLSLWMTWEAKRRPPEETGSQSEVVAPAPEEVEPPASPMEAAPPSEQPRTAAELAAPEPKVQVTPPTKVRQVVLSNDLLEATMTSRGGGLAHVELLKWRTRPSEGGDPIVLLERQLGEPVALATPMTGLGLGDLSDRVFEIADAGPRHVTFSITDRGVTAEKAFVLEEDSYRLRMTLSVHNRSAGPVLPTFQVDLPARVRTDTDFADTSLLALAQGEVDRQPLMGFGKPGLLSSLVKGAPELERDFEGTVEWVGAGSHYFLAALIPDLPRDALGRWTATDPGREAVVSASYHALTVPASGQIDRVYRVYLGPKEASRLEAAGPQLDRTINFGWSWVAPITRVFNRLLEACHAVIPNYGVAIILLTVALRLAMAPLTIKQMRSMKVTQGRMAVLQPKLKEIQEKYRDDAQRRNEEMMKLYREAGVNPFSMLGGCFPMLLQLPVFIALYYALQGSISLRQAPFMLWIQDLSVPETLFTIPGMELPVRLLPLLMGATMALQQKMTPTTTMDPAQARMMLTIMPIMMTVLFYGFPSGLVLYWFVSNLLAIGQQVVVNRGTQPA